MMTSDPVDTTTKGPETEMDRTVVVRTGDLDAIEARRTFQALRALEEVASLLVRRPDLFEIERGRAATTMIAGRSHRTAGGIVATRIADDAVIVQQAGGPGHIRFGTWRHELDLRFTDTVDPTRGLVPMPECASRVAVAARLGMAACVRIEADDRVIEGSDGIAMMDAAEDAILAGDAAPTQPLPMEGNRIAFASPWNPPYARLRDAPVPTSVLDRHWAMRDGTPMLAVGLVVGILLVEPVVRPIGRGATDPVVRLRRHDRDAEMRRLVAGWGMCTPPAGEGRAA